MSEFNQRFIIAILLTIAAKVYGDTLAASLIFATMALAYLVAAHFTKEDTK